MTAGLAFRYVLSADEIQVVGQRVGIQGFPTVLAIRPRYDTEALLSEAFDRATGTLAARGVISNGTVDADLVDLLHVLHRPDRELALRLVTPDGMARVSVVRRGARLASARRVGNELTLSAIDGDVGLGAAAAALVAELPAAAAAQLTPVGAPLTELSERLSGTHDSAQLADSIRALGADAQAAMMLGSALASRVAFAEIVCDARSTEDDLVARVPAAVAVFYTKRGRIVGAPSASPSGQLWSTLKPGSDHAISTAIGQLVELAPDGWGTPV